MQTNTAPASIASSHTPTPRRKGPSNAPNKSVVAQLKKAWRSNSGGMSLKEYARKNDLGKTWLANKRAFR